MHDTDSPARGHKTGATAKLELRDTGPIDCSILSVAESRVPCPRLRGHARFLARLPARPRRRGRGTHNLDLPQQRLNTALGRATRRRPDSTTDSPCRSACPSGRARPAGRKGSWSQWIISPRINGSSSGKDWRTARSGCRRLSVKQATGRKRQHCRPTRTGRSNFARQRGVSGHCVLIALVGNVIPKVLTRDNRCNTI